MMTKEFLKTVSAIIAAGIVTGSVMAIAVITFNAIMIWLGYTL